ncbi:MAG TPA: cytochrome d ubiquinol oxidase subunit II [Stellaceae bacterium]|nr:cytochrome d ubiquinol oxidase subunit II [Stellaceae bacterium]
MASDLPFWFGIAMAFGVAMYVISDGFDLGVGILFLMAPADSDRDIMMNSIAPIWDGNETWLVFGGTVLIGAFPVAYATLLPAFYLPLILMLFGLIFRGVAFEFRFRAAGRGRRAWDWAFSGGSTLAAFTQGLALGAYIDGVAVENDVFVGSTWGFMTGFAGIVGLGLIAGYALLGATWLILKTAGSPQAFGRRAARPCLVLSLLFLLAISIWTPLDHSYVARRWFSAPNIYYLWIPPALTVLVAYGIWRALDRAREALPFLLSIAMFLLALLGLGISLWPYAVPYSVTLWQAASSPPTLIFLGYGTVIIVPIILAYLGYAHWVFRGKTAAGTGYGH